jgi:hypothetical protein
MSLLRHNVDEDCLEEMKPMNETTSILHRESQMITAYNIQGAWHRQNSKSIGEF